MIDISIHGELPTIDTDLTPHLRKIGERMVESIRRNFIAGGRPAWRPLAGANNRSPLQGTGRLSRSVRYQVIDNSVVVTAGEGIPYARIHQAGGTVHPTITERSKKYFWAMFAATGDPKWKWMALKKPGSKFNVQIPARPYMNVQPEDMQFVEEILGI